MTDQVWFMNIPEGTNQHGVSSLTQAIRAALYPLGYNITINKDLPESKSKFYVLFGTEEVQRDPHGRIYLGHWVQGDVWSYAHITLPTTSFNLSDILKSLTPLFGEPYILQKQ